MAKHWIACVLLACATCVQAQNWTSGVADDSEYLYAATENDSAGLFGQFCYVKESTCIWVVMIETRCEENKDAATTTPILGVSSAGSFHLGMICRGSVQIRGKKYYRYVLDSFDLVDTSVRNGGQVGFALPLDTGQFRVVRFSVDGAVPVLDRMRNVAESVIDKTRQRSTKDRVL
jgi:hypothetical protein